MSKGFTIKATAPTPTKKSEEDFDLQAAKEMIRGKSIVFCLPGRGVSYTYSEKLCTTLFRSRAEWCKYSNLTGLFFHG
jgi:hypothetical protein